MNILFLDQFSGLGGGQRCLLEVVEEAVSRGWRGVAAIPGGGPLAEAIRRAGLDVLEIACGPYRSERKSAADVLKFGRDFAAQMRLVRGLVSKEGFDLIHVNGPRMLPVAAAARGSVPILFHAHSRPVQKAAIGLAGMALTMSRAVVACCCRYVADGYVRWVPAGRLSIVPNGVPDCRTAKNERTGAFQIGVIGRIEPAKGQAFVTEAVARAGGLLPPVDVRLWGSPGPGAGSYVQELRRVNYGRPVFFMGETQNVAAALASLDLLVVASENEGMPRVIAEAFSAGVPVLAFPAGGIPEIITDGATGFLTDDCSVEALVRALIRVSGLASEDLMRVRSNARRAWECQYSSGLFRSRMAELMLTTAFPANEEAENPAQRRRTV